MESEDLEGRVCRKARISKKALRREACRVAAAFGVRFFRPLTFNLDKRKIDSHFNGRSKQHVEITWVVDPPSARWTTLSVFGGGGDDERYCSVSLCKKGNFYLPHLDSRYNQIMAHGLYCLGFEDERVLAELNCPLSAHEKLELRLSMPRQFWPKTWVEGELSGLQRTGDLVVSEDDTGRHGFGADYLE